MGVHSSVQIKGKQEYLRDSLCSPEGPLAAAPPNIFQLHWQVAILNRRSKEKKTNKKPYKMHYFLKVLEFIIIFESYSNEPTIGKVVRYILEQHV